MSQNLLSASGLIGALRVNTMELHNNKKMTIPMKTGADMSYLFFTCYYLKKEWIGSFIFPLYQKSIQQPIHDIALQEQDSSILNSSKLDFYKNIYKIQTHAQYVDSISYRSDRSVLAKIRISAHNLTVEKGRYTGIPRHDRICKVCNTGSIENEQHFLLECPAYKLLREDFILKLEKVAINGRTPLCFDNRKYLYGLLNSNNNIIVNLMINRIFA